MSKSKTKEILKKEYIGNNFGQFFIILFEETIFLNDINSILLLLSFKKLVWSIMSSKRIKENGKNCFQCTLLFNVGWNSKFHHSLCLTFLQIEFM